MSITEYKTKALILAAGLGTRLAPITNDIPKSLVRVNGKPILFKQIENLKSNGIENITVVSGYKADVLKKELLKVFPDITIVESSDYENTNNMFSAYLGIKSMFSDGKVMPFLMMNADVFFDPSVVESLLEYNSPNAIVVDIGRYIEESMKVIEENGRLVAISKKIAKNDALGCSIDVYKFDAEGGNAFYTKCQDYIEKRKELKLWSEVALNDILSDILFEACPLQGRWLEIDNHEDLHAAEELFK
ncbi:phosphocholine cytidylyltransferase family protein [Butyrivibrio sp.]|jgi:choline kinase|uniref:phosphocholine cytidylyltransferase family protein n=1 Tax=Butyrivibrio sp. TaxID=28121 RepID=UPI0025C7188A|nr:phosphocholine cytidylyltransferase family protein [Butyrivibrio sp.]MBE5838005.1 phosphocholine cytidylyltransferase family protein [Butyrivibrio sp.]